MHDYDTGLDLSSFEVVANFGLADKPAGQNLASRFKSTSPGVWELPLPQPLSSLSDGELTVAVKDKQGNWNRIARRFTVEHQ